MTSPIIAYTDASVQSSQNVPPGPAGFGVHFPNEDGHDLSGKIPGLVGPVQAEFYALQEAVKASNAIDPSHTRPLHIHSDSQDAVAIFNRGGIQGTEGRSVSAIKVPGHAGSSIHQQIAHCMAGEAARR